MAPKRRKRRKPALQDARPRLRAHEAFGQRQGHRGCAWDTLTFPKRNRNLTPTAIIQPPMKLLRYAEADLPTAYGPFRLYVYRLVESTALGSVGREPQFVEEHMAIVRGEVSGGSQHPLPCALGMLDLRGARVSEVRLPRPTGYRAGKNRGRGNRRRGLPPAGGTRHRTRQQDPRVRSAK